MGECEWTTAAQSARGLAHSKTLRQFVWFMGISGLFEPLPDVGNDQPAGLLGGQVGIVDNASAERDHERGDGALAVALVTRGEVFVNTVGRAARRALGERGIQV